MSNLPEGSLGRDFYDLQKARSLPGLFMEVQEDLENIGINDLKIVTKTVWKKRVSEYIHNKQRNELLEDIKKYKKLNYEVMSKEKFERKNYFYKLNLEQICMRFKISSEVIPTVRTHFKNKYKTKGIRCPSCIQTNTISICEEESGQLSVHEDQFPFDLSIPSEEIPKDDIFHLVYDCPTFAEQQKFKDISDDADLCSFFQEIIQYRIENQQD